jgi:D-glycero-alpha-D-manno-heptose 1-phosphate guanylyltransferase
MEIIILAGGLGTRLRSVVSEVPKVMAPMNDGKPFLEYLIKYIDMHELGEIIVSAGYKSSVIKNYFGEKIIYSEENSPLGTAGAIKKAEKLLKGNGYFLVFNGDTFFEIDLKDFVSKVEKTKAIIGVALTKVKDTERYARVEINSNNKVTLMQRKLKGPGFSLGGIFMFRKELLKFFPEKGSLEEDVIHKFIKGTYGFYYPNYFIDIGIPEDYEKCKTYLPQYLRLF